MNREALMLTGDLPKKHSHFAHRTTCIVMATNRLQEPVEQASHPTDPVTDHFYNHLL